MSSFKKRINFFDSEEGSEVKRELRLMADDSGYTTESSYNANDVLYPGNHMTFVEKHMHYLNTHQNVNPQQYLSNLRLMTKVRQR
ncbi:MAG TPA: hypothetical protein VFC50_03460 [Candidatus Dormibacteraeota bacterium]|nr:hypothetical protein [Candidatus Dormibacteraeota bacterium]